MEGMLTGATMLTLTAALSSQPSTRSCLAETAWALQRVRAASVRALTDAGVLLLTTALPSKPHTCSHLLAETVRALQDVRASQGEGTDRRQRATTHSALFSMIPVCSFRIADIVWGCRM